jgi:hypothetical protein
MDSFKYISRGTFTNAPEALLLVDEVHSWKPGMVVVVVREGALCLKPYNPHSIIVTGINYGDLKRGDVLLYGFVEVSGVRKAVIRKLRADERSRFKSDLGAC